MMRLLSGRGLGLEMMLYLRQRILTVEDQFIAEDENGKKLYLAERRGDSWEGEDRLYVDQADGTTVANIDTGIGLWRPTQTINIGGKRVCDVKPDFELLRAYKIEGLPWTIDYRNFTFGLLCLDSDQIIMRCSRVRSSNWLRYGRSYRLNIFDPQHEITCLCFALVLCHFE